jgi:hypothetical protein
VSTSRPPPARPFSRQARDDHVRRNPAQGRTRGRAVGEGKNFVPFAPKNFGDHLHHGHFLISYEDSSHNLLVLDKNDATASPVA